VPSSEYNVNITITTKDKTSAAAKTATSSLGQLKQGIRMVAAAWAALRTAQKLIDFVKLGGQVARAGQAFESLAKSAGTSGDAILKSIQVASNYTIDNMMAMSAANKALIMEVAQTPAQFEELATVAVRLGRAMGLDAATAIDRFTVAAARKSIKVADDLGLTIDASIANEKYAKANDLVAESLTGAQQAQAFLNEMLEQGKDKVEKLGPPVLGAAEKIDILTSAWKNLRDQVALAVAEGTLDPVGGIEGMGRWAAEATERFEKAQRATYAQPQAGLFGMPAVSILDQYAAAQNSVEAATQRATAAAERQNAAVTITVDTTWRHIATEEELAAAQKLVDENQRRSNETFEQRIWLLQREGQQARDATVAAREHAQALQAEMAAAYNASIAMMDLAASYSSYLGQVAMSSVDYAGSMAEIEAQYQKTIEGITSGGGGGAGGGAAAAAREFDKADIERGLNIQKLQLEEYEKQRGEFGKVAEETEPVFWYELSRQDRKWLMESGKSLDDLALKREKTTDEATELEKAQMDDRIEDLKGEIAETERILKQGHWDQSQLRIGAYQRDTTALLEEAATRRDAQIAALEKSQAREELANQQSLGRIKLAAFDNWLSMQEDTDAWTQAQWDAVEKMRLNIMTEYGLLTPALLAETIKWQEGFDSMFLAVTTGAKAAVSEIQKVIDKLLEIPAERRIKIITEIIKEESPGITVPEITKKQHGGPVKAGMPYIVGEPNGELFVPQMSGYIIPHAETQRIINSNNQQTYNFPDARAMAYLGMQERTRARQGFAAASGM